MVPFFLLGFLFFFSKNQVVYFVFHLVSFFLIFRKLIVFFAFHVLVFVDVTKLDAQKYDPLGIPTC